MPSTDRLAELRRQRALMQEHLVWLDHEIAALIKESPAATTTAVSPPTDTVPVGNDQSVLESTTMSATAPISVEANTEAEAMLDEYRVAPGDLQRDVRKGCLLYFAAAMLLLFLGVAALYFAFRH